jgi:hypothetical protein
VKEEVEEIKETQESIELNPKITERSAKTN